ncbi:hypothetical protein JAAARDRAFT_200187 [Jaapia argillacea MUCL 33604]|uniref:Uncharacterized protein n=1 Tax=Jaapia argillacea MUCL 33604 TaxID=933084 RepID=A0A067P5K0_9AGAM|nr:hypothetical protein JAAARDRAFT_200187 [Jaapia argillacea MUCL 33604]
MDPDSKLSAHLSHIACVCCLQELVTGWHKQLINPQNAWNYIQDFFIALAGRLHTALQAYVEQHPFGCQDVEERLLWIKGIRIELTSPGTIQQRFSRIGLMFMAISMTQRSPSVSSDAFAHWPAWYTHVDLQRSVEHLSESCEVTDISLQWVIETCVPEFICHSDDMPPQYIYLYERPLLGLLAVDCISNYLLLPRHLGWDSLIANVTTLLPHTSTHLWHGGVSITPRQPSHVLRSIEVVLEPMVQLQVLQARYTETLRALQKAYDDLMAHQASYEMIIPQAPHS